MGKVRCGEERGVLGLGSLEWLVLCGGYWIGAGAEEGVSDLGNWELGGLDQRWKGRHSRDYV